MPTQMIYLNPKMVYLTNDATTITFIFRAFCLSYSCFDNWGWSSIVGGLDVVRIDIGLFPVSNISSNLDLDI